MDPGVRRDDGLEVGGETLPLACRVKQGKTINE
jgi:hypothetical protein